MNATITNRAAAAASADAIGTALDWLGRHQDAVRSVRVERIGQLGLTFVIESVRDPFLLAKVDVFRDHGPAIDVVAALDRATWAWRAYK